MKDNITIEIFIWIAGIIVALTVGSGMIEKTLTILGIPEIITFLAGWVVIISTILSIIIVVFTK
ncbi:MAG: hypothetical protein U9Q06_00030 [Nanoarchaeota archaeon]|nr:hypothetical protein [Nanoarchaeota archaeon]